MYRVSCHSSGRWAKSGSGSEKQEDLHHLGSYRCAHISQQRQPTNWGKLEAREDLFLPGPGLVLLQVNGNRHCVEQQETSAKER